MRKNIMKIASMCLLSLVMLTSCEEDTVTYEGSDFVTFENVGVTALSLGENAGTIEIPVLLTNPQAGDVTVNFTVTSPNGAVEGTDYVLVTPGSVTIPAGQTSAMIKIQAIDNEDFNLSKALEIKLTGTSAPGIAAGIVDLGSYYKKLTLINDDCPTNFSLWFGTLSVDDVGYPPSFPATGAANANGDCDVLAVTGDLGGFGQNSTFNFYFTPDFEGATTGTIEVPEQIYCSACSAGLNVYYSANGVYDETTGQIMVDYTVRRADNAGYTGQNIITAP